MKKLLYLFLFTFYISSAFAQPYKTIKKYKPYDWMVGVSWSVVEDDGSPFSGIFNVASSWNYLFYPTRISVDRYLKSGWSVEAVVTYNTYLPGKMVNGKLGASGIFLSGDINSKYSFTNLYVPKLKWLGISVGYGANQMLSAVGKNFENFTTDPYREYYLGLDVDLEKIKTNKNWLRKTFKVLNHIKVPAPTFEINQNGGRKFHWLYF